MPLTRFTCPECEETFRREPPAIGKKIRCPECDAVFRPPAEDDEPVMPASRNRKADRDDDDRPRKSKGKKKKQSNNAILIAIPIVALLLLAGGAVAYFGFIKPARNEVANNNVALIPGGQNNLRPQPGANNLGLAAKAGNGIVGLEVGNMAMEINGEDLDGKQFKLSDYRGKVVVLDFWGHW